MNRFIIANQQYSRIICYLILSTCRPSDIAVIIISRSRYILLNFNNIHDYFAVIKYIMIKMMGIFLHIMVIIKYTNMIKDVLAKKIRTLLFFMGFQNKYFNIYFYILLI